MVTPTHSGVFVDEASSSPRAIVGAATSIAAFVGGASKGATSRPVRVASAAEFDRAFGGLEASRPMSYAVHAFFDNGGRDAYVVSVGGARAPRVADIVGSEARRTGLHALDRVDLFNLLVVPDAAGNPDVIAAAVALCTRRRAFLIVDPPASVVSVDAAVAWLDGLAAATRSRDAAAYFPRVRVPDPLAGGSPRDVGVAGAAAGVYARTDLAHGVWKSPAGLDAVVVGTQGPSIPLTDAQNGTLNPRGLNCVRAFPQSGTVLWGARTLRGADAMADEYKYVAVRRTALFVEESVARGLTWAVFERNDEPLWTNIRLVVGEFMNGLFRQGAFQGSKPADAYFVKCDGETTTQGDVAHGVVNVVVGFAPAKPAEFVVVSLRQLAGRFPD